MGGATQIVQTPDFCVITKTPLAPLLPSSGEKSQSRVGRGGVDPTHASLHVQLKAGEGALTDFVPLLCPKFMFRLFFLSVL